MSLLVTIVTKHGNIEFTSFVLDPIETLRSTFGKSIDREQWGKNMLLSERSELADLSRKFKTIFREEAEKE